MSVFEELVGQADAVAALQRAVAGDGMTHAWLFTGPPGSGRSVAARAFAAALLCPGGGCGHCGSCSQVLAGSSADVVVVRPAGLSISVEEARDVVRRAALASTRDGWHVVLVEDADRLTERAANVWLKAIEEPAARAVFLLCAPSADELPPTIRSRCRLVVLQLPSADAVAGVLERSGIDRGMAAWAARAAQGHVGWAKALARDEGARMQREEALRLPSRVGTVGEALAAAADLVAASEDDAARRTKPAAAEETTAFTEVMGKGRGTAGLYTDLAKRQKSRETRAKRDTLDRALLDLVAWYRDVLSVQLATGAELVHGDQAGEIVRHAESTSPESTLRRVQAVLDCREAVAASVTPLLAVEQMALSLRTG